LFFMSVFGTGNQFVMKRPQAMPTGHEWALVFGNTGH